MNKHEFLRELKKSVSMLEDAEQNDLINEYSQHIDMKVQSGMTEEEAIADFGPIDELVEEVLAAYHVKAPEKDQATPAQSFLDGSKRAAGAAAEATKHGYEKVKGAAKHCFDELDSLAAAKKEPGERRSLWETCKIVLATCARWFWNFCVGCLALGCLLVAVCAVCAFGFCLVLLCQGYPLGGVSLALFGGSVASVCLTLLVARLLWLKKERSEPVAAQADSPTASPSTPAQPLQINSTPNPLNEVM